MKAVIVREANRLARLWNGMWMHHLSQDDVDALVVARRLYDFTHSWSRESGWVAKNPPVPVPAVDVNVWSLRGLAHDSINAGVVIRARCEREGKPLLCARCEGHGSTEAYPGQRAEAEAWEGTEPPTGTGWQLWETTSEGSPISPVFPEAEGLIEWMSSPAYTYGASEPLTREQAEQFVTGSGWAPTLIFTPETGLVAGEAAAL